MDGVAVRLTPRADRDGVAGERGDAVLIRVSAPPVDGRANTALIELVATTLRVPKGSVRIVRGAGSRDKVVAVDGLAAADVRSALLAARR